MTTSLVDKKDQLFVLNEMLEVDKLRDFKRFSDHSGFEMVLNEAHRFAKAEFYPTIEVGDREGCIFDPKTHSVKFPECYRGPYDKFKQSGWLAMCDDIEVGGDGFPAVIGTAVSEIFYASGFYIYAIAELSHAGAKVIEKYGTNAQRALYMTRLFSGEWTGAMCLTEPDAGSDIGAIQTSAAPNGDGTYSISGTKIFITAGEHDLSENIVHMVLARVTGDPEGSRGLSLFIVPKYLADEKGNLGDCNDVFCVGIEKKMGLHGLATCTISYGQSGKCTGYLLGDRGKGMIEMFHMMNEQRLLVGLQGLSYSSAAFLHAVEYTRNRRQGPSVYPGDPKPAGSVLISEHPDIKRMLLTMKAHVEGCRALAYYTSLCIDYSVASEGEDRRCWKGLVELLTPILKAYLTGKSWEITGMAIQCAGGYGYCADYPFERLARDCKITSIYEGTNGIQAIDLVFRKIPADNRANFQELMKRIDQTVAHAATIDELKPYAEMIRNIKSDLETTVDQLFSQAQSEGNLALYAKATPLLEAMGDVILGWLHLWQLTIAYPKLGALGGETEIRKTKGKKKNSAFYYGKVTGARFFIGTVLKRTLGKLEELKSDADPVVNIFDKSFSG
jgi:alkylation response protein AidB-like acyl-CoA dehydrogenase